MGRITKHHVCEIIGTYHSSMVLLYETHGPFNKVENFWNSFGFNPIFIEESHGHSGGI